MSKRTIFRLPYGIRVVRDSEWNEYVVIDPDGGTYHTDDKQDAIDTARSMWARATQEYDQPQPQQEATIMTHPLAPTNLGELLRAKLNAAPAAPATPTRDEYHKAFERMTEYGGGFAERLAAAWFHADSSNKARIEQAFADLIKRYL